MILVIIMCAMLNAFKNSKAIANLLSKEIFFASNAMITLGEIEEVREYLKKIDEVVEFDRALRILIRIHWKIDGDLGI